MAPLAAGLAQARPPTRTGRRPSPGRRGALATLAAASLASACGVRVVDPGARPTPPAFEDLVPRIAATIAHSRMMDGTAVLVDTRGAATFAAGHVQGAMSMPVDEVEADAAAARRRLPAGRLAVFYCT